MLSKQNYPYHQGKASKFEVRFEAFDKIRKTHGPADLYSEIEIEMLSNVMNSLKYSQNKECIDPEQLEHIE